MTRAQLLAEYLGVTPENAPGLFDRTGHGGVLRETLAPRHPLSPDLTRAEQAAWLLAMMESERCLGHDRLKKYRVKGCEYAFRMHSDIYFGRVECFCIGSGGNTPDAACLSALLAADADLRARWEACDE